MEAEAGAEEPRTGETSGPNYGCWGGYQKYHSSHLLSLGFPRQVREGLPFLPSPLPSISQGTRTVALLPMAGLGT